MTIASKKPSLARPLFSLGQIVATPGALKLLESNNLDAAIYLNRHRAGDWGDLDEEDKAVNAAALSTGARILSAYQLGTDRIWIITDACCDDGHRASTCLLLPEEY